MGRGEVHRVLVGKLERRRPLGRLSRRWEYNIKIHDMEIGLEIVPRIGTSSWLL
jgi:hypothetical protein